MEKFNINTPVGFRDCFLQDMVKKNKIESILSDLFINSGYNFIETPTLEYIDVFTNDMHEKNLYKLVNKNGEILALKGDITKSIARVVSTQTKNLVFPQRFCYITNVFRYPRAYQAKQHEFTQAGIELIGCNGVYADYEIIRLACRSLNMILNDYRLHISSVEFFNNYLDDLNISKQTKKEILEEIKKKNVVKIKELLDKSLYETISLILEAIGKRDLLVEIKNNIKNAKTLGSLLKLEKLYDLLEENGLVEHVYFDFSVLSFGNYYTGITLQGYTNGIGSSVLEGGRYDNLISYFGEQKSACGFAININDLIEKTAITYEQNIVLLFSVHKENLYRFQKDNCLVSLENNLDNALNYALANNIKTVIDCDNKRKYIFEGGKYICQK